MAWHQATDGTRPGERRPSQAALTLMDYRCAALALVHAWRARGARHGRESGPQDPCSSHERVSRVPMLGRFLSRDVVVARSGAGTHRVPGAVAAVWRLSLASQLPCSLHLVAVTR